MGLVSPRDGRSAAGRKVRARRPPARCDPGAGVPPSAPDLDRALGLLMADAPGTVALTVRPDPEAVTEARHFVTGRLDDWDLGALTDDVALVVTELVTNALRHSLPACAGLLPPTAVPGAIQLRLLPGRSAGTPWLLCGILDGTRQGPQRKEPDYIAETGRGLHLVDSFTHRWGWRGLPHGKVVWALFQIP